MTGHMARRLFYLLSRFLASCALRTFDICSGFLRAEQMSLCYYVFSTTATCYMHMLVSDDNRQHFVWPQAYSFVHSVILSI
jgi:hypothetical protein